MIENAAKKTILYLREITSGLDSGMTIQILNDYGYLSNLSSEIHVPVCLSNITEQTELTDYVGKKHFNKLSLVFIQSRIRIYRLLKILAWYFIWLKKNNSSASVIVLRGHKYLQYARLFRYFFGIPVLSELHEGGLPTSESKIDRLKTQRLFDKVDGVIFTNFSQVQYLRDRGYTLPVNTIVLPNGVDIHKFSQAQPATAAVSDVILTYAGQFTPWKNLPLLFESLIYLPSTFRLRIAGGKANGQSSRTYIENLTRKYGVEGRVDFLGFVHPEKVVDYVINGSSVLVLPLGKGDVAQFATSPMKLVEYMATSIPIVAVEAPSVIGLAGTDAVYLSQMNARDFADAILKAVTDDSNIKQRRIASANFIAKQYSHLERAKRYDNWLTAVIASVRQFDSVKE